MKFTRYVVAVCVLFAGFFLGAGCRNDGEESEKISSIDLDKERVEISVNEKEIVRVTAKTDNAKKNEQISYRAIDEGIVEIMEPNNDGFVLKGLSAGSTVIRIESQNVVRMLEVKVKGDNVLARYIRLEKPVIEVLEGRDYTTSVSLYGGIADPNDNSMFEWSLEQGKTNVGIFATGNIAVIRGMERGFQEINVSHPRADFNNKILVFVRGVDEEIKYIYRESNVLLIPNDGQYHDFDVALINGVSSDAVDFAYEVIEGQENIEEISGSYTKCNVLAKKSGTAVIKVSHPKAAVDFNMRLVIYDVAMPYIVLEETFLLLNVLESARITASVENARNGAEYKSQFSYKIIENNAEVDGENAIIEVIKTNESFYIRARRSGTSRLVISNAQAQIPRDVLIIVRDEAVYRDDYYITTEQNVITTQVGADMTKLYVALVGGNQSHANNFVWELDNDEIIDVYPQYGSVTRKSRAQAATYFEAYANIAPKKAGTARIVVSNTSYPETAATVIVRVFPAGTFAKLPVQVGYDGLIKVEYGKNETVTLRMVSGDVMEVGSLDWSIEDKTVAMLYENAHSLINVLSAVRSVSGGITKMVVRGDNIEFPHESIVIAGSAEYIRDTEVIYVDSVYQKVVEQQTIDVPILNSSVDAQGRPNPNWYPYEFTADVVDKKIAYAVMVQNVLKIMGKERGETDIIVRHPKAANESVTLHVRVEAASLSLDQPYYITGDEIKGVVRGVPTEFSVRMPGAPESEYSRLVWSVEDTSVLSASGSGLSVLLTGRASGRQTKVWVRHKDNKAEERMILVYVVETAGELTNIILGANKENYLLTVGQEQLVTVITNANDAQKRNISWRVVTKPGEQAAVTVEDHYDSGMVRAVRAGNATVEVSYANEDPDKYTRPLAIFVSVVDGLSDEKVIKGPAVIELIRGESKIVGVEHLNLTQDDLMNIKWEVIAGAGEEPLANIEGNGDSAYLLGLRKGVGKVKIWQEELKYTHYATLICANTQQELDAMYVMGVSDTYHKMLIGEEKKIKLTFGKNGFPETAKSNLEWATGMDGAVRVVGKGEQVSVVAMKPGLSTVTVTDTNNPKVSFNETLTLDFLVIDPASSNLEFRGHRKMVGIVVGETDRIEMKLYDGEDEVKNYDLWKYEIEDNSPVISMDCFNGVLDIRALSAGTAYITVTYNDNSNRASARILVFTALTADELDNYYPILVEKTNYLLQIGESAVVKIETMEEKDRENFSKVSWGVENAGVIESADFNGKKEVQIKGKSAGQCVISVNYNNVLVSRIFVTVVSNDEIDTEKYIVTESIVGLALGSAARTTKIFHNLGSEASKVVWESLDPAVVAVSGSGEEARLTAAGLGEAYVTVTYGSWLKRYIRVYVCADDAQVNAYKAMNMENQYYRAGVGEQLVLPVFFAPNKTAVATMWADKYENKVVRNTPVENGAKVEVETLNEGVAVLEAVNTGINDQSHVLRIYIEVSKKYNGAPKPVVQRFLTISKTIYVMNPDTPEEELNLRVSGVGYTVDELAGVTWQLSSGVEYVSIYPNGQECRVRVNPLGREGTAEISASKDQNELAIKVVASKSGMMGFPHIVGADTVTVGVGQKVAVPYEVAEYANYDLNSFNATVMSGGFALSSVKFNKNILEIEGKESGQALIRVTSLACDERHYKDVAVMVTTTTNGLVYLTTRDNFTQVKIGEPKTISVDMAGMNNPAEEGFIWTVEPQYQSYLRMNYSGRQAQVEGLEAGAGKTVPVKVHNTLLESIFDITLYVRVSDSNFNTMYLTTAQNVVTVEKGKSIYVNAELVNGLPGEDSMIVWQGLHDNIASVAGTGRQAYVIGKEIGFAEIQAEYPKTVNKVIKILVIVVSGIDDGMYISSTDTMVQMRPGDTREISVKLIGGRIGDESGFTWEVFANNPVNGNPQTDKVVEIIGAISGIDKTFIKGIREGEATIRVGHVRTNYKLDLKIYVQEYNEVSFDSQTLSLNVGEEKIVRVTMPPNTRVVYAIQDTAIISVSDKGPTSSTFLVVRGLAAGITKLQVQAENKPLSYEMIVTVNAVSNRIVQYIQTNDAVFNMIDWESAANRVIVTGTPVGEKKDKQGEFSDQDSLGLIWSIPANEGQNYQKIIEFDGINGSSDMAVGKQVSIKTKGRPGTEVVRVEHSDMLPDYKKEVYINVTPYDGNFIMAPMFKSMQVGETAEFGVSIPASVNDAGYDKVKWRVLPDEKGNNGLSFPTSAGENEVVNGEAAGAKAVVRADAAGVFKIKAAYEGREQEGIVYVAKARVLEVVSDSIIKIVPGTVGFIGLYHEPFIKPTDYSDNRYVGNANGFSVPEIDYINEYTAYVDIAYLGPVKDVDADGNQVGGVDKKYIPNDRGSRGEYDITARYSPRAAFTDAVMARLNEQGPNYNAILAVYGRERQGISKIKIKYNNIERIVTVNNSNDYTFNMVSVVESNGNERKVAEVRGTPVPVNERNNSNKVTIKYDIIPSKSQVSDFFIKQRGNYWNGNVYIEGPNNNIIMDIADNAVKVVSNRNSSDVREKIVIDSLNQTISFYLNRCGYTLLQFSNDFYDEMGSTLDIPVYVYYDKMNLEWQGDVYRTTGYGTAKKKSRLDEAANAIYIANNETINVKPAMQNYSGYYYIKGYYGDDWEISKISFNGTPLREYINLYTNDSLGNTVKFKNIPSDDDPEVKVSNLTRTLTSSQLGFVLEGQTQAVRTTGSDSLLDVKCLGLLEIKYKRSAGGQKKTEFSKNFLVYAEKWAINY